MSTKVCEKMKDFDVQYSGVNGKHEDNETDTFEKETDRERMLRKLRNVQTVFMLLASFGIGLNGEITGTTLVYLKQRIGINYEQMSRSLVSESVGQMAGQFVAGFLFGKFPQLGILWLSITLIVGSAVTCYLPWSPSLLILSCLFAANGFGRGMIAGGANSRIFQLWRENATVATHVFHFCCGVGFLLVPQIVKPFLPKISHIATNISSYTQTNESQAAAYEIGTLNTTAQTVERSSYTEEHIEIPYMIIAIHNVILGLAFFVLHFVVYNFTKKHVTDSLEKSTSDTKNPLDWRAMTCKRRLHMLLFLGLFVLVWILGVGGEKAAGRFLFSFVTETKLKFSPQQGSNILMTFWISFTTGRFLAALFSIWIHPLKLVTVILCISIASSTTLLCFGLNNSLVIWICVPLFALSLGPMFPSGMTCLNRFIPMTAGLVTLAFICSTIGNIGFTRVTGVLFDTVGPEVLMVILLVYGCCGLVVVVVIQLVACSCPIVTSDDDKVVSENMLADEEIDTKSL